MSCPYCADLKHYDLKPAANILVFSRWVGTDWLHPHLLETPETVFAHEENHPVSWRPDFFIPCGEGANDTRPSKGE
jgi:hypothetical protein